jgi:hypothetical protein
MTQLQKIVAKAKTLKKSYPNTKWTDLIKKASKLVTPASKSVGTKKKKKAVKKAVVKKAVAKKKIGYKSDRIAQLIKTTPIIRKYKEKGYSRKDAIKNAMLDAGFMSGTKTHKDTKSHNVNIRVMSGMGDIGENFTRVNNDVNGNPRYVIHFMDVLNSEERMAIPFFKQYEYAVKKAKKIGGKKYDNKQYGGGIVFQSYNLENTWKKIQELKHTTPKIKY